MKPKRKNSWDDSIASTLSNSNSIAHGPLSLRDPGGCLFRTDEGRLLRFISPSMAPLVETLCANEALQLDWHLVPTQPLDPKQTRDLWKRFAPVHQIPGQVGMVVEHEPVFFASYPHEWCPEALLEAGLLTLSIAEEAFSRGWGLKDATPYNVLFDGTQPVFVDWLSLETRTPGDPTWLAFGQFVRCFLLPLWMDRHGGLPLQASFLLSRDGVTPERAYELTRGWARWFPSFFTLIALPVWMAKRKHARKSQSALYSKAQVPEEQARFIQKRLVHFLRDQIRQVGAGGQRWSEWTGYLGKRSPYERTQWQTKKQTLQEWLARAKPKAVLDIGCNEGWFSLLAADAGAKVVAIDTDAQMVATTWRKAAHARASIQALHVDLCRPSPALGWNYRENDSFLSRAHEKFDVVAALAVIHHLTLGEQLHYEEVLGTISSLTQSHFFVEFVGPGDDSFAWAAKGRPSEEWNQAQFLRALHPIFDIVDQKQIAGADRTLYWLKKKRRR